MQNQITIMKINKYLTNLVYINTKIPQSSLFLLILYFFNNANLLKICLISSY